MAHKEQGNFDEGKVCRIRELGNELVMLEFEDEDISKEGNEVSEMGVLEDSASKCLIQSDSQATFSKRELNKEPTNDDVIFIKEMKGIDSYAGKTSSKKKHIRCPECTRVFSNKIELDRHIIFKHIEHSPRINGIDKIFLDHEHSRDAFSYFPNKRTSMPVEDSTLKNACFRSSLGECFDCILDPNHREPNRKRKGTKNQVVCKNTKAQEFHKAKLEEMRWKNKREVNKKELNVGDWPVADNFDQVLGGRDGCIFSTCDRCGKLFEEQSQKLEVLKDDVHRKLKCNSTKKHGLGSFMEDSPDSLLKEEKYVKCKNDSYNYNSSEQFACKYNSEELFDIGKEMIVEENETFVNRNMIENQIAIVSSSSAAPEENVESYANIPHSSSSNGINHIDSGTCTYYDKDFLSKPKYTSHISTLENVKPYLCSICQRSFSYEGCLRKHMASHMDLSSTGYDVNNLKHSTMYLYDESLTPEVDLHHTKTHSEQSSKKQKKVKGKPYECSLCQKKFAFQKAFRKHLMIHNNNNNKSAGQNQCKVCMRSFGGKRELGIHMSYHTRERTSELNSHCSTCGRYFKYVQTLERHKRNYCRDVKICECKHCTKPFSCINKLQKHQETRKEAPKCKVIKINTFNEEGDGSHKLVANFAYESSKLKNMDDLTKYECIQCQKCFKKNGELVKHHLICTKLYAVDSILDLII